jgi:hypothetical protein
VFGVVWLLASTSPARPKQPRELDPQVQKCLAAEQCFLDADKCMVNDGKGGKRKATPKERATIIAWWQDHCLLEAIAPPIIVH